MKLFVLLIFAIAAELVASWWTWVHSPTDRLRILYLGFWDYELKRLVPWSALMLAGVWAWFILQRRKR